ncbi:MAG: hypothetical protein MZV64_27705 [Ignavibacteriales bacterium]|nr:hypothetical protein [Ignavibacteriales bacterium]
MAIDESTGFKENDRVTYQKYGVGVVKKIINYGNKNSTAYSLENIGRRLFRPNFICFRENIIIGKIIMKREV